MEEFVSICVKFDISVYFKRNYIDFDENSSENELTSTLTDGVSPTFVISIHLMQFTLNLHNNALKNQSSRMKELGREFVFSDFSFTNMI